jgi:plasmid rolling circle replication initiator protein Rep
MITLFLTDLSAKDKSWDTHKSSSVGISQLYSKSGNDRYSSRIKGCSNRLEFAITKANELGETKLKLTGSQFCRVRHCSICQWRRSLKWRGRMFVATPKILAAYPSHRWLFLTLTIRNCELSELRSQLDHMNKSFAKLVKLKDFPAIGWIRSTEVTRGKDDSAHPHFHCLLLVPSSYFKGNHYLSTAKWAKKWQKTLKVSYIPMTNLKAIRAHSDEDLANQICHTLKYAVKPEDLLGGDDNNSVDDSVWLNELTTQLHKTRAVAIGGVIKDYLKEIDEDKDDLVHIKEIPDNEQEVDDNEPKLFFKYSRDHKRYYLT